MLSIKVYDWLGLSTFGLLRGFFVPVSWIFKSGVFTPKKWWKDWCHEQPLSHEVTELTTKAP